MWRCSGAKLNALWSQSFIENANKVLDRIEASPLFFVYQMPIGKGLFDAYLVVNEISSLVWVPMVPMFSTFLPYFLAISERGL